MKMAAVTSSVSPRLRIRSAPHYRNQIARIDQENPIQDHRVKAGIIQSG